MSEHSPSSTEPNTPTPKKSGGLLRSTLVFSGMTQISRVLGLIRDILVAYLFPLGGATDAFFVALKIPNFFRRLFAEGAFSQAFVPVFSEYKEHRTHQELRQLAARVSGTLATVLFVITAVGILLSPWVISAYAYGFKSNPETFTLASEFLKITFPYLFFISLTALAAGILNSFGQFGPPAIAPAFLNICLIVCAVWLSPYFDEPVTALAWGVFAAGVIQLLLQLPFLWRLKMLPLPVWGWRDDGVRRIMRLMLPAVFASAIVQLNLLLDTFIASFLNQKSVSWLYYSDRLVEFPLGVFGVAVATVILPALSKKHAQENPRGFTHTLDWALRLIVVIGMPAATGLVFLAGPMLTTLFQYGGFTAEDTRMAAYSLMAYSLGLPAFLLIKSLLTGFFAKQNTKTPVKIGLIAMVANMAMNIAIVVPMVKADFVAPHMGLALATAGSAWVQVAILFVVLKRQGTYMPEAGWLGLWLKTLLACAAMGALLVYASPADWTVWVYWERGAALAGLIAAGAAVYAVALLILGVRPKQLLERH